ncbi:MAG: hypothetical protein PHR06_13020 [Candidatus Cloacimonetes bacterium]|nr:hypothetical protein [Candidatus Cloacimonadota bacterium]
MKRLSITILLILSIELILAERGTGFDIFGPVSLDTHIYTVGFDVFGPVSLDTHIYTVGFDVFGPVSIDNSFIHAVPLNIAATITNDEVHIQWSVVSGATHYKIYSALSPDASFPQDWILEADNIPVANWTDASNLSKKFYRVVAVASERRYNAFSRD